MRSASLIIGALAVVLIASASPVSASPLVLGSNPHSSVIEIAPYGPYEKSAFSPGISVGSGFLAVRFDPPFTEPYTIRSIRFPSLTENGTPATFPSVRVLELDAATHQLKWDAPLLQVAPFVGSADGLNEIAANIPVAGTGQSLFLCIEVPQALRPLQRDYPLLAFDTAMERGWFARSYLIRSTAPNTLNLSPYRNLVASMVCELAPSATAPPAAPTALRANLVRGDLEFTYSLPTNLRMDGTHGPAHTIERVELLAHRSNGAWEVVASSQPWSVGRIVISEHDAKMALARAWAVRAVDQDGRRTDTSDAIDFQSLVGGSEFAYEPNGSFETAANVIVGGLVNDGGIYPAGDQDYYALRAKPGQDLLIAVGSDSLRLVLSLLDERGHVVATADTTQVLHSQPTLVYHVLRAGKDQDTPRTFVLKVEDYRGSWFSPQTIPIPLRQPYYGFACVVADDSTNGRGQNAMQFSARVEGLNQGSSAITLRYAVPSGSETLPATVRIYDVRGRLVCNLVDTGTGRERSAEWNRTGPGGHPVASGIYYARVEVGGTQATTKIVVSK